MILPGVPELIEGYREFLRTAAGRDCRSLKRLLESARPAELLTINMQTAFDAGVRFIIHRMHETLLAARAAEEAALQEKEAAASAVESSRIIRV